MPFVQAPYYSPKKQTETPFQRLQRIALMLISFSLALILGLLYRIHQQWTGEISIWPALLISLLLGAGGAFFLRKTFRRQIDKIVTIAVITLLLIFFWDIRPTLDYWTSLPTLPHMNFTTWRTAMLLQVLLWFGPIITWFAFSFLRARQPKGRLSLLISACLGLLFYRLLSSQLHPTTLFFSALFLLLSGTYLFCVCSRTLVLQPWMHGLILILLFGGIFATAPTLHLASQLPNPLHMVPFAPFAMRNPQQPITADLTQQRIAHGTYLRTGTIEEKRALLTSQTLCYLFKPAPDARIALRARHNDALLPTADTGRETKLKGAYDALWIELPEAWTPQETQYFKPSLLNSLKPLLTEHGLLIYHIDIRPLTREMLLTRAQAIATTFPHVQLWATSPTHWQLLASRHPLKPAPHQALLALETRPDIRSATTALQLPPPFLLLSACVTPNLTQYILPNEELSFAFREHRAARRNLFAPPTLRTSLQTQHALNFEWLNASQPLFNTPTQQ